MDKPALKTQLVAFPKVFLEANPKHDTSERIRDFRIDIGCDLVQDDDNTYHISLYVSNEDYLENNLPYQIEIHVYATFASDTKYKNLSKSIAKEFSIDVSNLLLGSVREMVASLTSRSPWGTYIMPFISAEELAKTFRVELAKEM